MNSIKQHLFDNIWLVYISTRNEGHKDVRSVQWLLEELPRTVIVHTCLDAKSRCQGVCTKWQH